MTGCQKPEKNNKILHKFVQVDILQLLIIIIKTDNNY